MSVFGENDCCRSSNFSQTHILRNFDHIYIIYKQSNCRNIWCPKITIILIMTVQALFFQCFFFSEKDRHLNAVECLSDNFWTFYNNWFYITNVWVFKVFWLIKNYFSLFYWFCVFLSYKWWIEFFSITWIGYFFY